MSSCETTNSYFFFFINCSVTVVLPFSLLLSPAPSLPTPTVNCPPLSVPMSPLSLVIPSPLPLWSLSVCSSLPSLWFYFAHLFCWLGSTYRWDHMVFLSFTNWLISLSIIFSSSIHAVTKGRSSFFLSAVNYFIVWMDHSFLIHSFTDGHLGCFQLQTVLYLTDSFSEFV